MRGRLFRYVVFVSGWRLECETRGTVTMKLLIPSCFALILSGSVAAQGSRLVTFPAVGVEATTPTGGELFTYGRLLTVKGAKLGDEVKAGNWLLEAVYTAGTDLIPVDTKASFKACIPYAGTLRASGPCFLDDDGDGRFDRHAGDEITRARKLRTPVPYTKAEVSVIQQDTLSFKILFQGGGSDNIRFSYREFSDDIARPAFTEELTIPREPFPQMIVLKKVQLEIIGLNGMGLRYRIVKLDGNM